MGQAAIRQVEGWKAELLLGLESRGSKTVLARRHQRGPLAIQRPFYPEGEVCHLYLLHPPGGIVGGDRLDIRCAVDTGAAALITTPGATKFYRSAGTLGVMQQTLEVKFGASLEWLPQENIFFPGGHHQLSTDILLQDNARFIGWESHCLGRPANNERFDTGTITFRLKILRNGKPLLIEKLSIAGARDLDAGSGLRGFPILATLVATGIDDPLLTTLQERHGTPEQGHIGLTLLQDILVCRYLGHSTEHARNLFMQIWRDIRPQAIQREACPPRIWST